MLTAADLTCSRGERRLFGGVGFELEAGDWLHVKGQNGCGKTTLLRTLIGLAPPDRGAVRWNGVDTRLRAGEYRRELVYLGHQAALKDELTPLENLRLALALDGFGAADDALVAALHRAGVSGRDDLPTRRLSAGQKRRVLMARLLLRRAALWVLDEPLTALDVDGVALLESLLAEHLRGGGVAVLTSHQPLALHAGQELQL